MMRTRLSSKRGFTLVELLIVIGLVGVIAALAGPSLYDYILKQRLRGVHAQLVTDLQFARSEAVSRQTLVGLRVQSGTGMTCYIIFTKVALATPACDCTLAEGLRCSDPALATEIRTVQVPASLAVSIAVPSTQAAEMTFDPRTGGMRLAPSDFGIYDTTGFRVESTIDSLRKLRTSVSVSGRVNSCAPSGSQMGDPACS
jgi:type IV fimbrial biogenesis protein FimT